MSINDEKSTFIFEKSFFIYQSIRGDYLDIIDHDITYFKKLGIIVLSIYSDKINNKRQIVQFYSSLKKKDEIFTIEKKLVKYIKSNVKNKKIQPSIIENLSLKSDEMLHVYVRSYNPIDTDSPISTYLSKDVLEDETTILESEIPDYETIEKVITFEPKYRLAGIGILQHFGEILTTKYASTPVGFSISQFQGVVKMIITTPSGRINEINKDLESYGQSLIKNKNTLASNANREKFKSLEKELDIANLRINKQKKKINKIKISESLAKKNLEYQEEQMQWFRFHLGNIFISQNKKIDKLIDIVETKDIRSQEIVTLLVSSISEKSSEKVENSLLELENHDPETYERLKNFVVNTLSSTTANIPSWASFLSRFFI